MQENLSHRWGPHAGFFHKRAQNRRVWREAYPTVIFIRWDTYSERSLTQTEAVLPQEDLPIPTMTLHVSSKNFGRAPGAALL